MSETGDSVMSDLEVLNAGGRLELLGSELNTDGVEDEPDVTSEKLDVSGPERDSSGSRSAGLAAAEGEDVEWTGSEELGG